jgi:small subunit ribosomal protein S27e
MKQVIPAPSSKFLVVMCKKCKSKQIIFSKASSIVTCSKCGEILAEPTGGKARIKAKVLRTLS